MNKYTARAQRSGRWWAISVPELPGVFTQVRRLDQVEAMARDAIALFLKVAADSFEVVVELERPAEVSFALAQRRRLREAELEAEKAVWEAIQALRAEGVSMRDIGMLLELSPQRISQLAG